MDFYSLIKKEDDFLIADIIEFENKSICVYWYYYDVPRAVLYPSISVIKHFYLDETRALIKDGVAEDYSDSKDLLYSS